MEVWGVARWGPQRGPLLLLIAMLAALYATSAWPRHVTRTDSQLVFKHPHSGAAARGLAQNSQPDDLVRSHHPCPSHELQYVKFPTQSSTLNGLRLSMDWCGPVAPPDTPLVNALARAQSLQMGCCPLTLTGKPTSIGTPCSESRE